MTLRHQILTFAFAVLPMGLLMAQKPAPAPADPAPVKVPKQDRPAPAPKQPGKAPAKKTAVGTTSKAGKEPAQKAAPKPGQKAALKPVTKNVGQDVSQGAKGDSKTAKRTGKAAKKGKQVEAEEMKKVTINIETKDASEEDEIPIPEGANEEDIRTIRGANAMLKAEKQLKKILKNLKVKGAIPVPFRKIDSWTYEDGFKGMPKDIRKLDGKRIVMAGFMLPIYEVENIKTFYLVRSLWSCCYGIPPDVNGLIRVEVKKKGGVNYQYDPIFIVGTFKVKETKDEGYTVCLYEIEADEVRVLDLKIK